MSSAKRKFVIVLPPILTVPMRSSSASAIILSRKILKRVGESKQPCLTPTVVLNQSPILLLKQTALVVFHIEVLDHPNQVEIYVVQPHGGPDPIKRLFEVNENVVEILVL